MPAASQRRRCRGAVRLSWVNALTGCSMTVACQVRTSATDGFTSRPRPPTLWMTIYWVPFMTPDRAKAVRELLAFYLQAGVDAAVGATPVDRFADALLSAPKEGSAAADLVAQARAVPPAPADRSERP